MSNSISDSNTDIDTSGNKLYIIDDYDADKDEYQNVVVYHDGKVNIISDKTEHKETNIEAESESKSKSRTCTCITDFYDWMNSLFH